MTNKQAATRIVRTLRRNGCQALFAGGCVRDMLLQRRPNDYDVATNARPQDVIALFRRTIKVGAKFGVVIVLMQNRQVEVATFRTESGYTDGRHPAEVAFSTPAEDAARRDFTVNGMFYDPVENKIIDYVGGREDLRKQIVRTIGPPADRFAEDYLRMLRAVRFSTQLGFPIEEKTWSAVRQHCAKITKISGERIAIELEGILVHPNRAAGASMLLKSGLAGALFPDLDPKNAKFGIGVLSRLESGIDFPLALASLFAGCSRDFALTTIEILRLSNKQTKHIVFLLENRDKLLDADMSLAHLRLLAAEPYFWDLYGMQTAMEKTRTSDPAALKPLRKIKRRLKELGDIELKPKPLLNGHDLMRLGATPGPALGHLAQELYIAQLDHQITTIPQASQWTKAWLKKHKQK